LRQTTITKGGDAMSNKQRKRRKFAQKLTEYRKRGLEFYMENVKIPCEHCGLIMTVHAYGKSKEVLRYACWNKHCPDYGLEKSMFNCHAEIGKFLKT